MIKVVAALLFLVFSTTNPAAGQEQSETDVINTSGGDLAITFLGHGTLLLDYNGKIYHVDPYSKVADYTTLPQADIILLTHHHCDLLDPAALELVRRDTTTVIMTQLCSQTVGGGSTMKNGDAQTIETVTVEATPEMVADAARAFKPKVLYPYHFGETDPMRLVELLKDNPEIEVRISSMK